MVERTAHNGLVVGSNPTGPNFFIKQLKNYLKRWILTLKTIEF